KGASTRPGSKQEIDRTIIELRYGIYDKIDYNHVARATTYALHHVFIDGVPRPIEQFAPGYREMVTERLKEWKDKGVKKFALGKVFKVRELKAWAKGVIKPVYLKLKS
ncbi:MAG TPA: hypothetical protein VGE62_01665, partial [Candidatus Paceibacterota bacterium]